MSKKPLQHASAALLRAKANYRASGRQVSVVIRSDAALAALNRLVRQHGGVTAAVTAALESASPRRRRRNEDAELPD